MSKFIRRTGVLLLSGVLFFAACSKDKDNNPQPSGNDNPNAEDSLKYLMYQIMQVTYADGGRTPSRGLPMYYWYKQVPKTDPLDGRFTKAEDLLNYMIGFPKESGVTIDRYSFLDREGTVNSQTVDGIAGTGKISATGGNFGLQYGFTQTALYVMYADKNSPAGKAGIQRGWQITAINGDNNLTYDGSNGPNVSKVYRAIFESGQVTLSVRKPNGTTADIPLTKSSYSINPVLFDSVYTVNGVRTGYFVFYTFVSVTDSKGQPTLTKQVLDNVFAKFKSSGIRNLIVDLRYNGGGSVSTAEYLDNAIAPASLKDKIMYYTRYNDLITQHIKEVGFSPSTSFDGSGTLQLDKVLFITTEQTASSSELTLNNLKPYFKGNLQVIGSKTYGKPVGFLDFNISMYKNGNKQYLADLYSINFETQNADNQGGYYNGIPVNGNAKDYINVAWGDTKYDDNLVQAFRYLSGGGFAPRASTELREAAISNPVHLNAFNGMVDYRKRIVR